MVRNGLTILAAVAASCCVCLAVTWATQPRVGVAVVDLDEVSKRLGRMTEMQHSLEALTTQTQQKLTAIEKDASGQLEEVRRQLGGTPNEEAKQKFQRMQQSAIVQLNQLKQKADQEVSGHRLQLVTQFREQARPIVLQVARQHGFSTVMTRNDAVLFSFEKTVDITDEVARLMAANSPAGQPAAAQKPAWPAVEKQPAEAARQVPSAVQQVKHEAP